MATTQPAPPTQAPRVAGASHGGNPRPGFGPILALTLLPALLIALLPLPLVRDAEWATFDLRMRLRNRLAPQPLGENIVLVGINEPDAQQLGPVLESREAFDLLLEKLASWGAAAVAFDIFFEREMPIDDLIGLRMDQVPVILAYKADTFHFASLPEGEPPETLAPLLEQARTSTDSEFLEEQFNTFLRGRQAAILSVRDNLLGGEEQISEERLRDLGRELGWVRAARRVLADRWLQLQISRPWDPERGGEPLEAKSLRTPSSALMTQAEGLGIATIDKSESSVVRRIPLVFHHGGALYPNFDLAVLCRLRGVAFRDLDIDWGRAIRFPRQSEEQPPIEIPIDDRGMYLVNYRDGESFLSRETNPSLLLALAPHLREEADRRGVPFAVEGAVVLVGELVAGGQATDLQPIPLHASFPMVGMHANVIDNALRGDYLRETPRLLTVLVLLLVAAGVGTGFVFLPFGSAMGGLAGLYGLYVAAAVWAFISGGLVLPLVVPGLATVFWLVLLSVYIVGVTQKDRRLVKEVFLRSVSPRIGEEILRNYDDQALWASRRRLTVLFVDIRGYTELSESRDPERVLEILDVFYGMVTGAVFQFDGQVNKFLGDAVMALFGALPEEDEKHAERALRAAVEIQGALAAYGRALADREPDLDLATGAGISTGEAVAGIVGRRDRRFEFTAIGDTVNLASRLQSFATRNEIVVTADTVEQVGGIRSPLFSQLGVDVHEQTGVQLKGKADELTVYKLKIWS